MIIIENLSDRAEACVPAYEYICDKCHQSFSLEIPYSQYGNRVVCCPNCGSRKVSRCIQKVRIARSEEQRMQQFNESSNAQVFNHVDENPAEVGRALREMGRESGAEMGETFNEVVDRLEHGQTSGNIDKGLSGSEQEPT